jgi:hypothetical protein
MSHYLDILMRDHFSLVRNYVPITEFDDIAPKVINQYYADDRTTNEDIYHFEKLVCRRLNLDKGLDMNNPNDVHHAILNKFPDMKKLKLMYTIKFLELFKSSPKITEEIQVFLDQEKEKKITEGYKKDIKEMEKKLVKNMNNKFDELRKLIMMTIKSSSISESEEDIEETTVIKTKRIPSKEKTKSESKAEVKLKDSSKIKKEKLKKKTSKKEESEKEESEKEESEKEESEKEESEKEESEKEESEKEESEKEVIEETHSNKKHSIKHGKKA